jgi:hypothetical protein
MRPNNAHTPIPHHAELAWCMPPVKHDLHRQESCSSTAQPTPLTTPLHEPLATPRPYSPAKHAQPVRRSDTHRSHGHPCASPSGESADDSSSPAVAPRSDLASSPSSDLSSPPTHVPARLRRSGPGGFYERDLSAVSQRSLADLLHDGAEWNSEANQETNTNQEQQETKIRMNSVEDVDLVQFCMSPEMVSASPIVSPPEEQESKSKRQPSPPSISIPVLVLDDRFHAFARGNKS